MCSLVAIVTFLLIRFDIVQLYNSTFNNKPVNQLKMSEEEKVKDFEYFYNTVSSSMPMLDSIKQLYGIDFLDRKELYLDLILQTQNDFEYFCLMSSIVMDIPSFHTDIVFPDYESYKELRCYKLEETLCRNDLKSLSDYWYSTLKKTFEANKEINIIEFKYVEGKYLFDAYFSSNEYAFLQGSELIGVNGFPVDDYAADKLSMWARRYDFKRNKNHRTYLTFGSSIGEKALLELRSADGSIVKQEAYINFESEFLSMYEFMFPEENRLESIKRDYYHNDEKNGIGYIDIGYFDLNTDLGLASRIINRENIIVDLRNNGGGNRKIASHLHSYLYADDIVQPLIWYVPESGSNQAVTRGNFTVTSIVNQLFHNAIDYSPTDFEFDSSHTYLQGRTQIIYKGNGQNNKNVYFLIGQKTGSAADGYVSAIKENGFGELIGTNTAGEGLATSFCADSLPNSGLVFIYMPCLAFNTDGTDNSLYGTAPDIYIEQTSESFYNQRNLQMQDMDIYEYQNRLLWDNVLLHVIDLIKVESIS